MKLALFTSKVDHGMLCKATQKLTTRQEGKLAHDEDNSCPYEGRCGMFTEREDINIFKMNLSFIYLRSPSIVCNPEIIIF